MKTFDVMVVGAGVFGAWTALQLRRSGRSVALFDAYGAGNNRSSSGGESRIIRAGYGADEIYTRWAMRSLELWTQLFDQVGRPELFQKTGVLLTPPPGDSRATATEMAFEKCGVPFQRLSPADLARSFPQFRFREERMGLLETGSGALLARRAVQAVVAEAVRAGVEYKEEAVAGSGGAGTTVYACGPWLPKIFPEILGGRIRVTRQEVFFFGTPAGDRSYAPPLMPVWADITDEHSAYTIPEIENRGFNLAFDRSLIPTPAIEWFSELTPHGRSWRNVSPVWRARRWWNREYASTKTRRPEISSSTGIPASRTSGWWEAVRVMDSNMVRR
jgi:sarcosine oxidase